MKGKEKDNVRYVVLISYKMSVIFCGEEGFNFRRDSALLEAASNLVVSFMQRVANVSCLFILNFKH